MMSRENEGEDEEAEGGSGDDEGREKKEEEKQYAGLGDKQLCDAAVSQSLQTACCFADLALIEFARILSLV